MYKENTLTGVSDIFKGDFGFTKTDVKLKNDAPTYKFLNDTDEEFKNNMKSKMNSKVKMWVTNSLAHLEPNQVKNAELNKAAYDLGADVLKYVAKYGTVSDKTSSKNDKAAANKMIQTLRSKGSYAEKLAYLKKNIDHIEDFTDKLGYYGNEFLFKTYKDFSSKDKLVYSSGNKSKYLKETQEIEETHSLYEDFKKGSSSIKRKAVLTALQNPGKNEYLSKIPTERLNGMFSLIVDDRGNIGSFESFKNKVLKQPTNINAVGSRTSPEFTIYAKGVASMVNWSQKLGYDLAEKDLKEQYYNLTKGYKQVLSEEKSKFNYLNDVREKGLGSDSRKAVGFKSINLSVDDNFKLKSFADSPKQENLVKIWNVLQNSDDSFGKVSQSYILPLNSKDDLRTLNNIEKNDLNNFAESSNEVMKNFLSTAKDLSNVEMVFLKYSNTPGYSQYRFTDKKTGKGIVTLINNNALKKVNEDLYMNSRETLEMKSFKTLGEKKLMPRMNDDNVEIFQNPKIKYSNVHQAYVLETKVFKEGSYVPFLKKDDKPVMAPPNITLEEASDYFDQILDRVLQENF